MAEEMLIVKSKIKAIVDDVNVSGDFGEALNSKVIQMVREASQRTKANGRKTIKPCDL